MTEPTGTAGGRRRGPVIAIALALLLLAILGVLIWQSRLAPDEAPTPTVSETQHPPALAETLGEEGTLKIEVVSLERLSPGTLELRMAVTHVGDGPTGLDIARRFSADEPDRGTLAEVYLADLSHQRKLFILRDADGVPMGSRDDRPLTPGERREVWARYPAPAEGDTAVVVHVPHAEPMPHVPIAETAADAAAAPESAAAPASSPDQ